MSKEEEKNPLNLERLSDQYKIAVDELNLVSKTNPKGIITYINKKFCDISGYSEEELLGQSHNIVRHPENPKRFFCKMWETIQNKEIWRGIIKNRTKTGKTYYVDTIIAPILNIDNEIEEYISVRHDVTELVELRISIEKEKIKYEKLASVDSLTGIYNRMKFLMLLEEEYQYWQINNQLFSLILIDIDHFKLINDAYGHPEGDQVLVEFAKLIKNRTRKTDIFGRIGGEEFAILIKTDKREAAKFAERIRATIGQYLFSTVGQITVSLGVCEIEKNMSIEMLIKKADDALYKAKKNGRNCVVVATH